MVEDLRLSGIETLWSVVRRAHAPSGEQARQAQQALLDRYGGAIRRYLLGALRDADAADEVFQEFSLNLVRGAFQRATPTQGKFRKFLKTSLFHLIIDYQRRARRRGLPISFELSEDSASDSLSSEQDRAFAKTWRDNLLAAAWKAMADMEQRTGKPYCSVLRFRVEHPDLHSPEIAAALSQQLHRPMEAGAARVLIHRAREMYADLLLEAVAQSLADPSCDALEEELIDLDLLEYCRTALKHRRESSGSACAMPQAKHGD